MTPPAHHGPNCRLAPPPPPPPFRDTTAVTNVNFEIESPPPAPQHSLPAPTPDATRSLRRYLLPRKQEPVIDYSVPDVSPPPEIVPQFFYSSPIPIDDPLSPATGPTVATATADPGSQGLRPFSRADSNALEKAWRLLTMQRDVDTHDRLYNLQRLDESVTRYHTAVLARLIEGIAVKHLHKHGSKPQAIATVLQPVGSMAPVVECCARLWTDIDTELQQHFCALVRRRTYALSRDRVAQEVMSEIRRLLLLQAAMKQGIDVPHKKRRSAVGVSGGASAASASSTAVIPESLRMDSNTIGGSRMASKETMTELESRTRVLTKDRERRPSVPGTPMGSTAGSLPQKTQLKPSPSAIAGSLTGSTSGIGCLVQQARQSGAIVGDQKADSVGTSSSGMLPVSREGGESRGGEGERRGQDRGTEESRNGRRRDSGNIDDQDDSPQQEQSQVAVGLSRLHVVDVATLVMRPIYWSPVNDVAAVMRATWFYKDTMLPVPVPVANQLESHYRTLRAWSQTWSVELKCAVDIGAAGEEKVSQSLWSQEFANPNAKLPTLEGPKISSDLYCAGRCFYEEAAAEGVIVALASRNEKDLEKEEGLAGPEAPPKDSDQGKTTSLRPYENYHIIYKDGVDAFLLKPSQRPSAYYGRRPISRIVKGSVVGIPVQRGFDRAAWEMLYEKSMNPEKKNEAWSTSTDWSSTASSRTATGAGTETGGDACRACAQQHEERKVTDLVLVVHGIGQKFAERVESFHFTHAINSFRRAVNMELQKLAVKSILRPEHNGIMVLPINWRHTLSFEDGGPRANDDDDNDNDQAKKRKTDFTLKDIEPPTIPAVRSLISDVMFDIPFYMSHHKIKMITALVSEANRVYRLWCRNNPGFAAHGRVHILAHSLGSAMAVEILSHQPSRVPPVSLATQMNVAHFEFNVTNLILCGSPAAFFLLLDRGCLLPRRGRMKEGADPIDVEDPAITGSPGTLGCLAVDNVYNVLAKEDPIAYLLNGTIDPEYAANLKTAYVPSSIVGWSESWGGIFRPFATSTETHNNHDQEEEQSLTKKLPANLELETHDFSREETAEKKAYLLNDNGQVDWYLRGTGGLGLDMQYLNMLSAHSRYWTDLDFIRLVVVEVGRRPGKAGTVSGMRRRKGRESHRVI